MKFFYLIISILVFASTNAQSFKTNYPGQSVPAVFDFIQDGKKYGFNAKPIIDDKLEAILFMSKEKLDKFYPSVNKKRTGSILYINKLKRYVIVADSKILRNTLDVKSVLYHELYHLFGGEHTTEGITAKKIASSMFIPKNVEKLFFDLKKMHPEYIIPKI